MSGPSGPTALRVTCWGTRGSVPCPGPDTLRLGGNTACLEVHSATGTRCIFDAGTGLRPPGEHLLRSPEPLDTDLFLTHFRWDHIHGLPFFGPLYDSRTRIRLYAPPQEGTSVGKLLSVKMGPPFFPAPFEVLPATVEIVELNGGLWRKDDVEVSPFRTCHPACTCGYGIDSGGAALAYIPDNELGQSDTAGFRSRCDELVRFLEGTDVLFHDATYCEAEYSRHRGWGHSTFRQAVHLAEDAGVRRLYLFHHAPARSDTELVQVVEDLRSELARRNSPLEVHAAAEGDEVCVGTDTRVRGEPPALS